VVVVVVEDSRVRHVASTGAGVAEDLEVNSGAEDVAVGSSGGLGVPSVGLPAAASHHKCC
jgi:hypothetical protein